MQLSGLAVWGGGAVAVTIALIAMRGKWDLVLAHGRDLIRHLLAAILMLGTLAGTLWTFSAGTLTFAGASERLISVGGVAAALECGAIYTGWYIGQLDLRIFSARKPQVRSEYKAYQKSLYRWFYAVVGISFVANLIFRTQQLDNLLIAAFVSFVPCVLIVLFTIKLRPLPVDYAEIGRQATQRSLVQVVKQASHTMSRMLGRMGRGEELSAGDVQLLQMSAALVRIYAPTDEQHALDHAISQGAGAKVIEASAETWLTTGDLQRLYGCKLRTAQDWMAACPGRRRATKGRAWEAPASAIYAAHGVPPRDINPALTAPTSADERGSSAETRGASADERETSAASGVASAALVPAYAAAEIAVVGGDASQAPAQPVDL